MILMNETPCGHPLGGCTVSDLRKTELLGRPVTCYSLHCCEPGHVHKWVYWLKGHAYELPSERRLC